MWGQHGERRHLSGATESPKPPDTWASRRSCSKPQNESSRTVGRYRSTSSRRGEVRQSNERRSRSMRQVTTTKKSQPTRMTKSRWAEFFNRLKGSEGCHFRLLDENKKDSWAWKCGGGTDQSLAKEILQHMGLGERAITSTLTPCQKLGGYCDCEIMFNVAPRIFPNGY